VLKKAVDDPVDEELGKCTPPGVVDQVRVVAGPEVRQARWRRTTAVMEQLAGGGC